MLPVSPRSAGCWDPKSGWSGSIVQTIFPLKCTTISRCAPQDTHTTLGIVDVGGALRAATGAGLTGDREREAPAEPHGASCPGRWLARRLALPFFHTVRQLKALQTGAPRPVVNLTPIQTSLSQFYFRPILPTPERRQFRHVQAVA